MSRAYWEQARDAGQRQVDYANSVLYPEGCGSADYNDPPEAVAEASIAMAGMDGLEVATRMQTESDMRWLLDERLERGLITHHEAREAFLNYTHYLDTTQTMDSIREAQVTAEDAFNWATEEMIRTGRITQSEGELAMHDFKMSRATSPGFYT